MAKLSTRIEFGMRFLLELTIRISRYLVWKTSHHKLCDLADYWWQATNDPREQCTNVRIWEARKTRVQFAQRPRPDITLF